MKLAILSLVFSALILSAEESGSATAFARAAEQHFRSGDYQRSEKLWKSALRRDPSNPDYLDSLGRSYERQAEAAAFPFHLNEKARRTFAHALAIEPANSAALIDLIELEQIPVGLCEGNLVETSALIDRLQQIDPIAATREREYWHDAVHESRRLGQRALCAPVKIARSLSDRVFDHLNPTGGLAAAAQAPDTSTKMASSRP